MQFCFYIYLIVFSSMFESWINQRETKRQQKPFPHPILINMWCKARLLQIDISVWVKHCAAVFFYKQNNKKYLKLLYNISIMTITAIPLWFSDQFFYHMHTVYLLNNISMFGTIVGFYCTVLVWYCDW